MVRLGAMGDILHALPAVSALRAAHPDCLLGWAIEPQWRGLLRAESAPEAASQDPGRRPLPPEQPLVDRIHLIPAKHWARHPLRPKTLRSILRTRAELRQAGYAEALDLQGAVRSALVARWTRSRRLLGEDQPRELFARRLFHERVPSQSVHVIEQAADVVRALDGHLPPLGLPVLPHDAAAAEWCTAAGIGSEAGSTVLLHPGAGWGAKRWPVERYAQAAALLARQTGVEILVHAAPGEQPLAEALARELHSLGIDPLVLTPTLSQLIELSRRISLAIGGDTGPLHLAAALGKPTVGIYGPTDPARNGPFHGSFRVLRDPSSRRDHTRHKDPEPGLLRIAPEAVAEAALSLLCAPAVAAQAAYGGHP